MTRAAWVLFLGPARPLIRLARWTLIVVMIGLAVGYIIVQTNLFGFATFLIPAAGLYVGFGWLVEKLTQIRMRVYPATTLAALALQDGIAVRMAPRT